MIEKTPAFAVMLNEAIKETKRPEGRASPLAGTGPPKYLHHKRGNRAGRTVIGGEEPRRLRGGHGKCGCGRVISANKRQCRKCAEAS